MNQDQVSGKWKQIKGRAKKAWAALVDDAPRSAEGSVDKLKGAVQETYGDAKAVVKKTKDEIKAK